MYRRGHRQKKPSRCRFQKGGKEDENSMLVSLKVLLNHDVSTDTDVFEAAYRRYGMTFLSLQEYYITHHADGIIVTAATALAKILRGFQPETLIMDETSQLTEHAAVAVISRFSDRLDKVCLLGDAKQTSLFENSEAELMVSETLCNGCRDDDGFEDDVEKTSICSQRSHRGQQRVGEPLRVMLHGLLYNYLANDAREG